MSDPRPNIIIVTLHDLGRNVRCYDPALPPTPAIERIATEGVVFENHFSTCPLCSPARSSVQTGRYPHSNGMNGLTHRGFGLNSDEQCLAHYLNAAGYHTALYGLQHEVEKDTPRLGYREIWTESRHCLDIAPRVEEFLARPHHQPFLLSIGFQEVHRDFKHSYNARINPSTLRVPPYLIDCPEVREDLADFFGLLHVADRAMGQMLASLDSSGAAARTLLLFTTDHGWAFPRAKSTLYDPGIGVTLLARWPGRIAAGGRIQGMTSHVDILPTLLELAGAPVPRRVQGHSFARLFDSPHAPGREEIYAEKSWHGNEYDPMRCIRTLRHKYIRNFTEGFLYQMPLDIRRSLSGKAMEASRRKPRAMEELYDLQTDPNETVNLAGRPEAAALLSDLRARLDRWMADTGDPLPGRQIPWPQPTKECFLNNMG